LEQLTWKFHSKGSNGTTFNIKTKDEVNHLEDQNFAEIPVDRKAQVEYTIITGKDENTSHENNNGKRAEQDIYTDT